jgi:NADH:ubiquinone oxidoreductase subunit D
MMMANSSLNRRHAEFVSASTRRSGTAASADGWTLKQVQGDANWGPMLADTTAVLGAMDIVFEECDR